MSYYKSSAVNWSSLKHMAESPLVYRHRLENERTDTAALALGRVTHTLVFEPGKFDSTYAIWTEGDRKGKAYAEFVAANEGKTIFKPKDIETATAMAEAVRNHPLVRPYLVGGLYEHAIYWTDPETKIACKARPDWLLPAQRTLLDLKSTKSIDARRFGNDAARYSYYAQLGHYDNGVIHALGWVPKRRLIVAVEKDPPHDVAVFELSNDDIFAGKEEVRALLARLKECRATGHWPGRYETEQALQLPGWLFYDEEDAESFDLA
jgi:hypothetical protein